MTSSLLSRRNLSLSLHHVHTRDPPISGKCFLFMPTKREKTTRTYNLPSRPRDEERESSFEEERPRPGSATTTTTTTIIFDDALASNWQWLSFVLLARCWRHKIINGQVLFSCAHFYASKSSDGFISTRSLSALGYDFRLVDTGQLESRFAGQYD